MDSAYDHGIGNDRKNNTPSKCPFNGIFQSDAVASYFTVRKRSTWRRRRKLCGLWAFAMSVTLAHLSNSTACAGRSGHGSSAVPTTTTAVCKFWWNERRSGSRSLSQPIHGLFRSIPALSSLRKRDERNVDLSNLDGMYPTGASVEEVAVKTKKKPPDSAVSSRSPFPGWNQEFFLGITPQTLKSLMPQPTEQSNTVPAKQKSMLRKRVDLREGMSEALDELRSLRQEMERLREELGALKRLQMGGEFVDPEEEAKTQAAKARQKRRLQRQYEQVSSDVERWADDLLFPSDTSKHEGWVEIPCNKLLRSKLNRDGRTRVYLTWMKDSRGSSYITKRPTEKPDEQEWPCIRLYSTIDAPCDEVSLYLSNEEHVQDYNQLLDQYKDLDTITSHSKICWAQSPQILFIKPRDFVTYCSHRWRRDGTQVVINQACDAYDDSITANAFAFRGATFIGPDPDDPEVTRIAMLAHASPGKDVPSWACKAAIQSLAPIEPYRLFHKINEGVKQSRDALQAMSRRLDEAEMVRVNSGMDLNSTEGRTSCRPAGIALMGFACFWPNGGGVKEEPLAGVSRPSEVPGNAHSAQDEMMIRPLEENDTE
jgi:hypothetical protein